MHDVIRDTPGWEDRLQAVSSIILDSAMVFIVRRSSLLPIARIPNVNVIGLFTAAAMRLCIDLASDRCIRTELRTAAELPILSKYRL